MKMISKNQILFAALIVVTLLFQACKKKPDDKDDSDLDATIQSKVYVLNEGAYGAGNASVSIYDASTNKVYNNLFKAANDKPIGDVLQSMCLVNGKAYFVINNSNKIEITNTYPLTSVGVINDLSMPRYMVAVNNNKAYVSEYVSYASSTGRISVIDLTTKTVSKRIDVGTMPEMMLLDGGKMYVCISSENRVVRINTSTDEVEDTITVTKGPNSIVKDTDGKIWVICGGKIAYDGSWNPDPATSTAGALVKIDPATGTVDNTYTFGNTIGAPSKLTINGALNTLYYDYDGGVYTHAINAGSLSSSPIISRSLYGLGVDPNTDYVYIGTYGFSSNQRMVRYTSSGVALDSLEVGVGPNGFVFNY